MPGRRSDKYLAATDDRHLRWLRKRCDGQSIAEIAAADGASYNTVKQKLTAIRREDIAHSPGENADAAYWCSRHPRREAG